MKYIFDLLLSVTIFVFLAAPMLLISIAARLSSKGPVLYWSDRVRVINIFNIRHKKRDLLKEYLLENGIQTEVHYPVPPNKQDAILKYIQGSFPISEEIHSTTLSLPISFSTTKKEVIHVCKVMNSFL